MQTIDFWRTHLLEKGYERPALLPHAAVEALRAADYGRRAALSPEDHSLCEIAALIHDIGKAPSLAHHGFHPLDGANFVMHVSNDERLASLVAHHSGASYEATLLGITLPFVREKSLVSRIIDWCDMTTLQSGLVVTVQERRDDILARYGPDATPSRALDLFWDELLETDRLLSSL